MTPHEVVQNLIGRMRKHSPHDERCRCHEESAALERVLHDAQESERLMQALQAALNDSVATRVLQYRIEELYATLERIETRIAELGDGPALNIAREERKIALWTGEIQSKTM